MTNCDVANDTDKFISIEKFEELEARGYPVGVIYLEPGDDDTTIDANDVLVCATDFETGRDWTFNLNRWSTAPQSVREMVDREILFSEELDTFHEDDLARASIQG